MMTHVRQTAVCVLAAAILLTASCASNDRLPCHPASGRVVLNGKPIEGAELWLFPTDVAVAARQPPVRPYGKTTADGTFQLMTYLAGDGAPAGDYKVRVICERKSKAAAAAPADDEESAGLVNVLPARYGDPDKSGLTATIQAGSNTLPDFQLKK